MTRNRREEPEQEVGPKKLHEYSGGGISVRYERKICVHSGECVQALPLVFQPKKRRWISPENSDPAAVIAAVEGCPSGALSYQLDSDSTPTAAEQQAPQVVEISSTPTGCVRVVGNVRITMPDGTILEKEKVSLCRCGASLNKPFCDGQHREIGFEAD